MKAEQLQARLAAPLQLVRQYALEQDFLPNAELLAIMKPDFRTEDLEHSVFLFGYILGNTSAPRLIEYHLVRLFSNGEWVVMSRKEIYANISRREILARLHTIYKGMRECVLIARRREQ